MILVPRSVPTCRPEQLLRTLSGAVDAVDLRPIDRSGHRSVSGAELIIGPDEVFQSLEGRAVGRHR